MGIIYLSRYLVMALDAFAVINCAFVVRLIDWQERKPQLLPLSFSEYEKKIFRSNLCR